MTDPHPITPPPELVEQWYEDGPGDQRELVEYIATQAARWSADQELEACVEWLQDPDLNVDTYKLRAARRPKPTSLAKQALKALHDQTCATAILMCLSSSEDILKDVSIAQERVNTIRAALERLQELEQSND